MYKRRVLGNNTGQLLGGALGVLDIFGSHIDDSSVTGIPGGYTAVSYTHLNMVYDSATDTIYVYNRYQLELMKEED